MKALKFKYYTKRMRTKSVLVENNWKVVEKEISICLVFELFWKLRVEGRMFFIYWYLVVVSEPTINL